MNKVLKFIKLVIKAFGAIITLISKVIFRGLMLLLTPLSEIIGKLVNKIHISLTFKLNLIYGMSYMLFFFITYKVVIETYFYHLEKNIPVEQRLINFEILLTVCMGIFFVLFLLIGKFATRGLKKSLENMNETIKHIDANALQSRLDISGTKDELKDLAETFNAMMDKLEHFIESQKQFVSDASHELRTPIAVLQGYANLLKRWGKEDPAILEESIESIKQEAENMQQLVEKLLFLARADKQTQLIELETINLSEIAKEMIKHTKLIEDMRCIKESIQEDILICGDKSLIKELLRIFMDNAIKYTKEDGEIEVIVKQSGKNAILSVRDTGIGIEKERIAHIFERFYQVDEARTQKGGSSGLGLSIAKWIIEAHKGKIYVNSILGEGTEFVVFYDCIDR